MALHVHYKTLYILQPSSAKQQREITTFCVFKTTQVPTANFSCFYWKMKPPSHIQLKIFLMQLDRLNTCIQPFAKFVREMQVQFLIDVFLDVAVVVA